MREKFLGLVKGSRSTLVLVGLGALGILFMFLSAEPLRQRPLPPPVKTSETPALLSNEAEYRLGLERDLTALLHRVSGVGEVVVLVTLESGFKDVYGENKEATERMTREDDGGGGRREVEETTSRTEVVVTRDGPGERPLVLLEKQPRLRGVIVIAEGAGDPRLRKQLVLALQAGLDLAAHRITVLPMK